MRRPAGDRPLVRWARRALLASLLAGTGCLLDPAPALPPWAWTAAPRWVQPRETFRARYIVANRSEETFAGLVIFWTGKACHLPCRNIQMFPMWWAVTLSPWEVDTLAIMRFQIHPPYYRFWYADTLYTPEGEIVSTFQGFTDTRRARAEEEISYNGGPDDSFLPPGRLWSSRLARSEGP